MADIPADTSPQRRFKAGLRFVLCLYGLLVATILGCGFVIVRQLDRLDATLSRVETEIQALPAKLAKDLAK